MPSESFDHAIAKFKRRNRQRNELVAKARIMSEFHQSWKDIEDMELSFFIQLLNLINEQDEKQSKRTK